MKTNVVLSLLILILLVIPITAAQEQLLPDPGTTPDSWLYGFKRFFEGVHLFFTFDPADKAKLHVQLAELRLSEAKAMVDRGKPELANSTAEEYGIGMDEAQRWGETIVEAAKQRDMKEVISRATSIHLEVLKKVMPDELLYKAKRKAEVVGISVAPTMEERAKKQLNAAGNRSAEAKAMAAKGKSDLAKELAEDYEEELNKSMKYGEQIAELAERGEFQELVANATSIHLDVLEEVYAKVPKVAKLAIKRAINASIVGQEESLNKLGEIVPELAGELYFKFAEKRLLKAREKAGEGKTEEVIDLIEEYERKINKSSELKERAEGIGRNITQLTELVGNATSKHLDVLNEVLERVPEIAKSAIRRAMNVSAKGQEEALKALQKIKPEMAEKIEREIPEETKRIREEIGRPETIIQETKAPGMP